MKNEFILEANFVSSQVKKAQLHIDIYSQQILGFDESCARHANLILPEDHLVFPGFVDIHVHCRQDASGSLNYKEDFSSAAQAALNGGVVAMMDMPNTPCPPVDLQSYREKELLVQNLPVEIIPFADGGGDLFSLGSQDLPFKIYMGPSVGGAFLCETEDMRFNNLRRKLVSFHCEDYEVMQKYNHERAHGRRRPKEAEIVSIKKALELIERFDLEGIICHISSREGFELVEDAKNRGIHVKLEVAPHHLFFSEEAYRADQYFQVNPPLRTLMDCVFLLERFKKGKIDFLATDHAPHSLQEKKEGTSGLPHLDTYGFVVGKLLENGVPPEIIYQTCCLNPGRIINRYGQQRYGDWKEGFHARFNVWDPKGNMQITQEKIKSKCLHSPFLGEQILGEMRLWDLRGEQ